MGVSVLLIFQRERPRKLDKNVFRLSRSECKHIRSTMPKYNPNTPLKNEKLEVKRREFLWRSGGMSGVYNISDKQTAAFVKEHREFIPDKEIYRKNKKGTLVPVYRRRK